MVTGHVGEGGTPGVSGILERLGMHTHGSPCACEKSLGAFEGVLQLWMCDWYRPTSHNPDRPLMIRSTYSSAQPAGLYGNRREASCREGPIYRSLGECAVQRNCVRFSLSARHP